MTHVHLSRTTFTNRKLISFTLAPCNTDNMADQAQFETLLQSLMSADNQARTQAEVKNRYLLLLFINMKNFVGIPCMTFEILKFDWDEWKTWREILYQDMCELPWHWFQEYQICTENCDFVVVNQGVFFYILKQSPFSVDCWPGYLDLVGLVRK